MSSLFVVGDDWVIKKMSLAIMVIAIVSRIGYEFDQLARISALRIDQCDSYRASLMLLFLRLYICYHSDEHRSYILDN